MVHFGSLFFFNKKKIFNVKIRNVFRLLEYFEKNYRYNRHSTSVITGVQNTSELCVLESLLSKKFVSKQIRVAYIADVCCVMRLLSSIRTMIPKRAHCVFTLCVYVVFHVPSAPNVAMYAWMILYILHLNGYVEHSCSLDE